MGKLSDQSGRSKKGLLHQFGDLFEFGVVGGSEQFEDGHFRGGDLGAFGACCGKADFLIFAGPRRNRIGNYANLIAGPEQIDGRLVNADMRLNPTQQNLFSTQAPQRCAEPIVAAAAKARFVYRLNIREKLGNLRHRRPQSIGALLAPEDWNIEDLGGLDKDCDILE
jgi:hypothetical protein